MVQLKADSPPKKLWDGCQISKKADRPFARWSECGRGSQGSPPLQRLPAVLPPAEPVCRNIYEVFLAGERN